MAEPTFFEADLHAGKPFQSFCGIKFVNPQHHTGGDGSQRIGNVELAQQGKAELFAVYRIFYAVFNSFDVVSKDVGVRIFD